MFFLCTCSSVLNSFPFFYIFAVSLGFHHHMHTENPELLSLHACQQHPVEVENKTVASGWIHSLSHAIMHQLKDDIKSLLHPGKYWPKQNHQVTKLPVKLDAFAKLLNLTPYAIRESSKRVCSQFPILQFKQFMLFVLIASLVLINAVLLEPFCKQPDQEMSHRLP